MLAVAGGSPRVVDTLLGAKASTQVLLLSQEGAIETAVAGGWRFRARSLLGAGLPRPRSNLPSSASA
eukprot:9452294-Alexandrium_andersonii.AAC.1